MSAIISSNIINSGEGVSWFIDREPDYNLINLSIINNINNFNNFNINNFNIPNSPTSIALFPSYFAGDIGYHTHSQPLRRHPITVTITELEITEEECDCCICFNHKEKREICRLQCSHSFCGECIKNTLKSYDEAKCPLCREIIVSVRVQTEENREKISEYCVT
jgi:hypothetical protein